MPRLGERRGSEDEAPRSALSRIRGREVDRSPEVEPPDPVERSPAKPVFDPFEPAFRDEDPPADPPSTSKRRPSSVSRTLTTLIACTAIGLVLFVACVFLVLQIGAARQDLRDKGILASRLAAFELAEPLIEGEAEGLDAALRRAREFEGVDALAVRNARGERVAASANFDADWAQAEEWSRIDQPILDRNRPIGSALVIAGSEAYWERIVSSAQLIGALVAITIGFAVLIGHRVQRVVTDRLLRLVAVADKVREDDMLHLRAEGEGDDEIGRLVHSFNAMLDRIRDRDIQLRDHRAELEEVVEARTHELSRAVEEAREAEAEATAARDAAEAASEAKTRFLANVSHEIRTPMNAVLGMGELLADTEMGERQRHMVRTIRASGEALLALINDILDLSKIEAGKLELAAIEFDLGDAIDDTVGLLAERAHKKGLELSCLVPEEIRRRVLGDPNRLRQILINLLGNAIKFTDRGDVVLRAAPLDERDRALRIAVEVEDTGIGVALDKQERVFESFVQADDSNTRKHGGTGLGLAISKNLVRMMDGDIELESEPGRGSVFRFTARFELAEERSASSDPVSPGANARLPDRALIVDDNATNREILAHHLRAWGVRVTAAAGGEEALERAREAARNREPFDVAILDGMMPGMDGFELAERIAGDPELGDAALVMLTSIDGDPKSESRIRGKVRRWLTKPVRAAELRGALEGVDAPPAKATSAAGEGGALGFSVLVAEDNPVNQDVVRGMLETLGCEATVVDHGGEAIDALETARFDMVLMDCHMPVLDGYAAAMAIRKREAEDPSRERVPILALTANAMAGARETCLEAGMDDFLTKPFEREALRAMLRRWGGSASAEAPEEQRSPLAASEPEGDFDRERTALASTIDRRDEPERRARRISIRRAPRPTEERERIDLRAARASAPDEGASAEAEASSAPASVSSPSGASVRPAGASVRPAGASIRKVVRPARSLSIRRPPPALAEMRAAAGRAEALDLVARSKARSAPPEPAPPAIAQLDPAALDAIRQMEAQGVAGIFERVISKYLTMSEKVLDQMRAAAAEGDVAALTAAAHSLKSSSANLGAAELAEMAARIEEAGRAGQGASPAEVETLARERGAVEAALRLELERVA